MLLLIYEESLRQTLVRPVAKAKKEALMERIFKR